VSGEITEIVGFGASDGIGVTVPFGPDGPAIEDPEHPAIVCATSRTATI
jgi:hypothetical protein